MLLGGSPGATVLTITVAEIRPGNEAFVVAVEIQTPDGQTASLGTVSLFSTGQKGRFTLPVRGLVGQALATSGGTVTLSLQPIAADRPLSDQLEVAVSNITLSVP